MRNAWTLSYKRSFKVRIVCLPICLCMEHYVKHEFSSSNFMHLLSKHRSKLRFLVCHDSLMYSMLLDYAINVFICQLPYCFCDLYKNDVHGIYQSIHDDPYCIMFYCMLRSSSMKSMQITSHMHQGTSMPYNNPSGL